MQGWAQQLRARDARLAAFKRSLARRHTSELREPYAATRHHKGLLPCWPIETHQAQPFAGCCSTRHLYQTSAIAAAHAPVCVCSEHSASACLLAACMLLLAGSSKQ
jgi:hypothetical protein